MESGAKSGSGSIERGARSPGLGSRGAAREFAIDRIHFVHISIDEFARAHRFHDPSLDPIAFVEGLMVRYGHDRSPGFA